MRILSKTVSKDIIQLSIPSDKTEFVNIRVINIIGQARISVWEEIKSGLNYIQLNTSDLPQGSYRILVRHDQEQYTEESLIIIK